MHESVNLLLSSFLRIRAHAHAFNTTTAAATVAALHVLCAYFLILFSRFKFSYLVCALRVHYGDCVCVCVTSERLRSIFRILPPYEGILFFDREK